jgi:hypothetical protein
MTPPILKGCNLLFIFVANVLHSVTKIASCVFGTGGSLANVVEKSSLAIFRKGLTSAWPGCSYNILNLCID